MLKTHLAQGRLAPAYLLIGPEGVGKRMTAVEMAKALNCEQKDGASCDQCGSCTRMQRRVHPDLYELMVQGASHTIGIDAVRQVLGRTALRPYMGRFQVVIVDGADRFTEEAANSLLKALEEPPPHTRFFLVTAQPSHCLPTIRSRCSVIRFQRLSDALIKELLEQVNLGDPQMTEAVSRLAQGSLSKALELVDQWDTYRTFMAQCSSDQPIQWLEWTIPNDRDILARWLMGSIIWLRDVAVASVDGNAPLRHVKAAAPIHRHAQRMDRQQCLEAAIQMMELWQSLEHQVSPRLIGTLMREQWLQLLGQGAGMPHAPPARLVACQPGRARPLS